MTALWDKFKKEDPASPKAVKGKGEKEKEEKSPQVVDGGKKEKKKETKDVKKKPENKGEKEGKKEKKSKKGKKGKKRVIPSEKAERINSVLIQPKISEASMTQQVLGKYVFVVAPDANKFTVAEAIESMYGVTVEGINIMNYKPKSHSFKGHRGQKKGFKKAVVSLKQGDTIDLFKEVK